MKKKRGEGLFLKHRLLFLRLPSTRSVTIQSTVVKCLITFCQWLSPGTQETMTSPTSQHRWEPGQSNGFILQMGKSSP